MITKNEAGVSRRRIRTLNDQKAKSVKDAAEILGISRSTLYGYLSRIVHEFGADAGTHTYIGRRIVITPENFEKLKERLLCMENRLSLSGMEQAGQSVAMSEEREYERALSYARELKKRSQEKLQEKFTKKPT